MVTFRHSALALIFSLTTGCLVGKDYSRPDLALPEKFPGGAEAASINPAEMEKLVWWELFKDEALQSLITRGLERNLDLMIAANRVDQAKAALGFTNSDMWPSITASGASKKTGISTIAVVPLPFPGLDTTRYNNRYTLDLDWEIDLWGKLRRASESARAQLVGTKAYEGLIRQSVVTGIATAFYTIKDLRRQLKSATDTVASREQGLQLWLDRERAGMASSLEIEQARSLVFSAKQTQSVIEQQLSEANSSLAILLGEYPDGKLIAQSDSDIPPDTAPATIPAMMLEHRPDLIQAELNVVAANADVGAAFAEFLPSVQIAGYWGGDAVDIGKIITGPARVFALGPNVSIPIFQGGKLFNYYDEKKAILAEAVNNYKLTVVRAFKEVYDAKIATEKTSETYQHQARFRDSLAEVLRLSRVRYETGSSNFLDLLDAEREYFQAELTLSQRRREKELALVQLYKALGGGWELKPEEPKVEQTVSLKQ
jgi:multidrug efflux system outer membrane protein